MQELGSWKRDRSPVLWMGLEEQGKGKELRTGILVLCIFTVIVYSTYVLLILVKNSKYLIFLAKLIETILKT